MGCGFTAPNEEDAEWGGRRFRLVDTGGLIFGARIMLPPLVIMGAGTTGAVFVLQTFNSLFQIAAPHHQNR